MKFSILIVCSAFLACWSGIEAQTCSSSNQHICATANMYKACNTTTQQFGNALTCSEGLFCTSQSRCAASVPQIACQYCYSNSIACISQTETASCTAPGTIANGPRTSCSSGLVCVEGRCTTAAPGTETCQASNACTRAGRFVVPYTGCKSYILCVNSSNQFNRYPYDCLGSTLFSSAVQQCVNSANFICETP